MDTARAGSEHDVASPHRVSDGAKQCLGLGPVVVPAFCWDLASLRVDSGALCLLALPEQCPKGQSLYGGESELSCAAWKPTAPIPPHPVALGGGR